MPGLGQIFSLHCTPLPLDLDFIFFSPPPSLLCTLHPMSSCPLFVLSLFVLFNYQLCIWQQRQTNPQTIAQVLCCQRLMSTHQFPLPLRCLVSCPKLYQSIAPMYSISIEMFHWAQLLKTVRSVFWLFWIHLHLKPVKTTADKFGRCISLCA